MDNPKFELDCKNRKLTLKGACLDLLEICKGMCCRKWNVPIQQAEYETGGYQAKKVCVVDGRDCAGTRKTCLSRQYRLDQREDGSCVYLNDASTCSIYDRRPLVCRNFYCRNGWEIASTCPPPKQDAQPKETGAPETHQTYETALDGEMTFMANPLMRLITLFYAKDRKKLTFIIKPLDKCSHTACAADFDHPSLDDGSIRCLIGLFDGQTTIEAARAALCAKYGLQLPAETLRDIVRTLYHRGILLYKNGD